MYRFFAVMVCAVLYCGPLAAQHQAGTLSCQLGYDGAVHATKYQSYYSGVQLENDTSAAATQMFAVTVEYNILNWLSSGLTLNSGSYIEDPEDAEANGNSVWFLSLDTRAYPLNHEKFNMYLGFDVGLTRLEINRINSFTADDLQYHYSGPHIGAFAGFNWYLFNVAGIFFQMGYAQHNFQLDDYAVNTIPQNLTGYSADLTTYGVDVRIGVDIRIDALVK